MNYIALTFVLALGTTFIGLADVPVYFFFFWFLVWGILVGIGCLISTQMAFWAICLSGRRIRKKELAGIYCTSLLQLTSLLFLYIVIEFFSVKIPFSFYLLNGLAFLVFFLYIYRVEKNFPKIMNRLARVLVILWSLLPAWFFFYWLMRG